MEYYTRGSAVRESGTASVADGRCSIANSDDGFSEVFSVSDVQSKRKSNSSVAPASNIEVVHRVQPALISA